MPEPHFFYSIYSNRQELEHKNWFVLLEFSIVFHQAKGQGLQGNTLNKQGEAPAESPENPKMYTFTGL